MILDPEGKQPVEEIIDHRSGSENQNQPLIITGDEGCGKTHLIIKWLMEFNRMESTTAKEPVVDDQASNLNTSQEKSSETADLNMSKFEQKQREMMLDDNPNINKNGNVVFTFFAGIESINSMVQLDSLKPLKRSTINPVNLDNDEL